MVSIRYMLVCALFGLATLAEAQIVECVDANGKKVYSQSCPSGTERQRDIEVPATSKPNIGNDASKKALSDEEKAFARRREERLKAEEKDAEQQRKSAQAAQECEVAHRRLEVLESGRQYKRADPDTGEHVPMDEDQRAAEIDRLHAQALANCP